MIILLWALTIVLFVAVSALLVFLLWQNPRTGESLKIVTSGIKEGLKGSGWAFRDKTPLIEYYQLEIAEDVDEDDICEDCLDKLSMPPMDIADWMKEGFPKNPPHFSKCGGECQCELVLVERKPGAPKKEQRNS